MEYRRELSDYLGTIQSNQLAPRQFSNAGWSIIRTAVSRSHHLCASIFLLPSRGGGKSPPCHTRSFLISCKPLLSGAAVCHCVMGGIFYFLLNGKRWVSSSDEPALHQVLVILCVHTASALCKVIGRDFMWRSSQTLKGKEKNVGCDILVWLFFLTPRHYILSVIWLTKFY